MAATGLEASDQAFYGMLDRIAYANPFSEQRGALVEQLVPDVAAVRRNPDNDLLAQLVATRLSAFSQPGDLAALSVKDRRLVESGFLYVCYHHHTPAIDALIRRQAEQGEEPLVHELAQSIASELGHCGLSAETAWRYFALFFQMRRAFYFILHSLAGECVSMQHLRRALWDNIFTHDMRSYASGLWSRMEDFSTLLLGETGSGKGAAAGAIGRSGFIPYLPDKRRFAANFTRSFTAINLSQFPDSLIESELFGHRKGAFTGAIEHHQGVFEICSAHGALFLDEVGEVSIPVQIKLLQVLQTRVFNPLGSHEHRRFAGRVIAATNRPLDELRAAGKFRDDLYYRLCSDVIAVPPLRQRIAESPAELALLVRLLVGRIAGAADDGLDATVMRAIERDLPPDYQWPGNVRELEQAVRRVLLTGRYGGDTAMSSPDEDGQLAEQLRAGQLSAEELLGRYCAMLYRRFGTYADVAARTGLDRRTVRSHLQRYRPSADEP